MQVLIFCASHAKRDHLRDIHTHIHLHSLALNIITEHIPNPILMVEHEVRIKRNKKTDKGKKCSFFMTHMRPN